MGLKGERGPEGLPGINWWQGMMGIIGKPGFVGAPGSKGDKEMPGSRGPQGPQGREGSKGDKGLPGISGLRGPQGEPGSKGEKGEGLEPTGHVPRKQRTWKNSDVTTNGKIKDCSFNKLQSDTALKVSFQGIMRVAGTGTRCNRWYFKFNNKECSGPVTIEAVLFNWWPLSVGNPNLLYHRFFEGCCENLPQGVVKAELWVGPCSGYTLGDAATEWTYVSRIMIEEVSRPQS